MKIYFAGSISGGRNDREAYSQIVKYLGKHGTVLTEHVGSTELLEGEKLEPKHIFERDVTWLKDSDAIVAEVRNHSLGAGYELGISEYLKKPVLCLYRSTAQKKISPMLPGNGKFKMGFYTEMDAAFKHIDDFFNNLNK